MLHQRARPDEGFSSTVKAIEKYHFRPTYAGANVRHPSCSYWALQSLRENYQIQSRRDG
jgi:hypothetical protein